MDELVINEDNDTIKYNHGSNYQIAVNISSKYNLFWNKVTSILGKIFIFAKGKHL